jgi:hypothetical protein
MKMKKKKKIKVVRDADWKHRGKIIDNPGPAGRPMSVYDPVDRSQEGAPWGEWSGMVDQDHKSLILSSL